ncbi:MAG: histidine kinase [Lachnospiraceae bacterium]|nr:histidine kinase [Lachnospiraceae bacterium]MCI8984618.1 histidine kinase [Lachnospiraceae bacterium]MCI9253632.1 histidine kinase [Lachnospiraceae bacterium]
MHRAGKQSFVQMMNLMMGIQMAAVSVLLIIFAVSVYSAARKETDIAAENFLHIYATQIENRIQKVDMQLTTIINEDEDLQLLESEDEAKRHYASVRLAQSINDIINIDQSADIFVITEADHNICIDAKADNLPYADKNSLRSMFMDYAEPGRQTDGWKFQKIGDTFYLYRAIVSNRRVTAAAISAESLLKTVSLRDVDTYGFVLTDADDMVKAYAGYPLFDHEVDIRIDALRAVRNLENREEMLNGRVRLYSYESRTNVFRHLYKNAIFILAVIALLCVFDLYFMGTERKQIIQPMQGMIQDMERIRGGDYELRVEERGDNQEFSLLSRTFNQMMDEIVNLKIRFYEKQLALSDAEQKYIRLQIRPHFFLNAMTTIAGLSAKKKNAEIEKYINALSKNIRYMFSSGLHTVSVKEELHHVENYFEMQEMRYAGCIFYFIEMPEELEDWQIPQMLIHTLIENEYKYGISQGHSLMVLIKASVAVYDGEDMLLIEIEDDGKGYPEEVLTAINQDRAQQKEDGTRVGLWSVKRLLELMYDRKNLFLISNVEPHGALNQIYIPRRPVNERSMEYMDEQGIR